MHRKEIQPLFQKDCFYFCYWWIFLHSFFSSFHPSGGKKKPNTNTDRNRNKSVDGCDVVVTHDLCEHGNLWHFCRRRQTLTNHPGNKPKAKNISCFCTLSSSRRDFVFLFFVFFVILIPHSVKNRRDDWLKPPPPSVGRQCYLLRQAAGGCVQSSALAADSQPSVKHEPDRKLNTRRHLQQSSRLKWKARAPHSEGFGFFSRRYRIFAHSSSSWSALLHEGDNRDAGTLLN